MTFSRARAPGFWAPGSTILQSELEHIDDYSYAIDSRGGTYAPAALITIGGSGLTVSGPLNASNIQVADVKASLTISLGATLQMIGNQVVNSGSIVGFTSGSFLTVQSGATLTTNSGSTSTFNGTATFANTTTVSGALSCTSTVTLNSANSLAVNPARTYTRVASSILEIDTAKWARSTPESNVFPMVAVEASFITPGSVPNMLAYTLDVPNGATITAVKVAIEGAAPAHIPSDRPQIYLYKVDLELGTSTLIGSAIDGSGAGGDYILLHDISLTGLSEVVNASKHRYVVRVEGEGSTGGVLGLKVCAPRVTFTRATIGEE